MSNTSGTVTFRGVFLFCLTILFVILPFWIGRFSGGGFGGAALSFLAIALESAFAARFIDNSGDMGWGMLFLIGAIGAFFCAIAWVIGG